MGKAIAQHFSSPDWCSAAAPHLQVRNALVTQEKQLKEDVKILWTKENTKHFTDKLYAIEPSQRRQALMDLFAIGCYLRLAGKHNAGTKACLTALEGMQLRDEEAKAIWQGLNDGKEIF